VVDYKGRKQIVVIATNKIRSYDFETGKVIWECGGLGSNPIPQPVRYDDLILSMTGHMNPNLMAIRLGREGDLTGTDAIVWSQTKGIICLESSTSIRKAIQLIEQSPFDRAFVLNGNGRYLGAVAIADLRRLLISGALGEEEIGSYPPRHSYSLTEDSLKSRKEANNIISDMQLYSLRFIPILGNGGKIQDVLSIEDLMRLHGFSGVEGGLSESSRRVLVVGGAGFLGSVLTQKLLGRGFKVRVLDSFLYGRKSLDPLTGDENLEIVEGDLRNIHTCVSSLADVDAVVLLAAIVGDPASKVRPTETIETNVLAAQALASACKLHHINRFLYASTCSVYGIGADLLDEEAPLIPVSLYARTKIESEKIILGIGDEYFSPTILRMGTLYGYSPRMRFDLVVNTWIGRQILQA
jgi:CBS domain-containing protein